MLRQPGKEHLEVSPNPSPEAAKGGRVLAEPCEGHMEGCQASAHIPEEVSPGSDPTSARFWNQNKEGNQELILQPSFSHCAFCHSAGPSHRPNPTGSQTVKGLVREPEGIGRDTGAANASGVRP